jgi:ATP-binding cassette subfamily G (WHITE) protein 2 (SNQ2)
MATSREYPRRHGDDSVNPRSISEYSISQEQVTSFGQASSFSIDPAALHVERAVLEPQPLIFTWKGISYWVPVPKLKEKRSLQKLVRRKKVKESKAATVKEVEAERDLESGSSTEAPQPPPQTEQVAHVDAYSDAEDGELQLLYDVFGFAQPRRLLALCGASGAGKSTLLDVLANRKTKGRIAGEICVNGEPVDYSFLTHFMGYVEQRDLHISKQTVHEAVLFAARTRLPPGTPDSVAKQFTEYILEIMNLSVDRNRLVGSEADSEASGVISSDARKRLSIAVEYAANASLYFLDEPTSGLDARSALRVMRAIRALADNDCAVVSVIHQPSFEVFGAFDDLLLMRSGGRTVYFGELGDACTSMTSYFARNGAEPIDDMTNPADYMLRVIGGGIDSKRKAQMRDWADIWQDSPECKAALEKLEELKKTSRGRYTLTYKPPTRRQQWRRAYYVTIRQLISYWRTPTYNFSRMVLAVALGLMIGLFFLKLPRNNTALDSYVSVVYLSLLYGVFLIQNVLGPTFQERAAFYREIASGTYKPIAYAFAIGIAEIPYTIVGSVIFTLLVFFMVGYPAAQYGYFLLMNILFSLFTTSLGQLLAALLSSQVVGVMIVGMLIPLMNVFSGFLQPYPDIPHWLWWAYYADPYRWALEGVVVACVDNVAFHCDPGEFRFFPLPPSFNGDCSDGGTLNYYNETSASVCAAAGVTVANGSVACCRYCPVTNGRQIIEEFGLHANWKWIDIGAVAGFYALFRIANTLALLYIRHLNR